MAFLELEQISKRFKNGVAVENFDLQVSPGEFVSFLGPSGCGKTTSLRMIAGFETPTSGTIRIAGQDVTYQAPNRRSVGMVFQSYALFPNMTVAGNIGFGLKVAKQPAAEIQARVQELLQLIHLPGFEDRYPFQLSGGQQQRVALARALAIRPQVLLLDEPLSALDAKIRVELRNEIRRIQQELGITTIYVTHDQEEALSLSDRVVVMNAGHIEQIGTPLEIYNFPQTAFTASFVGQINLFNARVVDSARGILGLDGQTFIVEPPLSIRNETQVRLAIRPEELQLGISENQNNLLGKVEKITFLGSIVRMQVNVDGERLNSDLFNTRLFTPPQVGEQVTVNFPAQACWVVGDNRGTPGDNRADSPAPQHHDPT
jgi:putative spermidine/putrescine transport system ATP-binding protein